MLQKFKQALQHLSRDSLTGEQSQPVFVSLDLGALVSSDCPGTSLCSSTVGLTAQEILGMSMLAGANPNTCVMDLSEYNADMEEHRTGHLTADIFYHFLLGIAQRPTPANKTSRARSLSNSSTGTNSVGKGNARSGYNSGSGMTTVASDSYSSTAAIEHKPVGTPSSSFFKPGPYTDKSNLMYSCGNGNASSSTSIGPLANHTSVNGHIGSQQGTSLAGQVLDFTINPDTPKNSMPLAYDLPYNSMPGDLSFRRTNY